MPRFRMPFPARKTLSTLTVLAVAGCGLALTATPAVAAGAPPIVTSDDFPEGDAILPMLGEVGTLTIDSPDDDVVSYRVFFPGGTIKEIEVPSPEQSVTLDFRPMTPGRQLIDVNALHEDGTGSRTVYSFRVSAKGPVASYDLADAPGSTTIVDSAGTNTGTPGSGVELGVPGPDTDTAAAFDGSVNAYIDTETRALVNTGEGFAAAAWVKLDDLGRDQAITSVNGRREAGFVLGYRSTSTTSGTWMLEIADTDTEAAQYWRVTGGKVTETNRGQWVHVAGVFDATDKSMKLYLNGNLVGTSARKSEWNAQGTIQIGRATDFGRYVRQLDGALSQVRVFDRVVFDHESDYLETLEPSRAAYWQLTVDGAEYGGGEPLVLADGAEIYTMTDPDGDDPLLGKGHLELNGSSAYAHTDAELVDTRLSFSVTTKAKLTKPVPDRDMTVFALPGENTNLVEVKYAHETDSWRLVVAESDSADAGTISIDHGWQPSTSYRGNGLSVTYDAFTGQFRLWVEGIATEPLAEPFRASWVTTGIQIGRSGVGTEHFFGAIDDVRMYSGACDADLIDLLSGPVELEDH